MAVVVPALNELRDQLDEIAPDRDRRSDGAASDAAHQAGRSSHNSDRTQNAEHKDGDAADEIRARDFDKDLGRPDLTMARVVQHLVMGCRSGRFRHIRYIIYDGVIYHRNVNNFAARAYTGSNRHGEHAHINHDFTQAADTVRGVDYGLRELVSVSAQDVIEALQSAEGKAALWAATLGQDRIQGYDEKGNALPEVPGKPAENDMTVATAITFSVKFGRMMLAQLRDGLAGVREAIVEGDVDLDELVARLAPAVAATVVANLPADNDDVTQDEVTRAVEIAFAEAFGNGTPAE